MIHNIADITPGGAAAPLKTTRTPANWLQVNAPTGNTAVIRLGDSTTSAASGITIPAGQGILLHPIGAAQYLDLAQIYVYGAGTDKVSAIYGTV